MGTTVPRSTARLSPHSTLRDAQPVATFHARAGSLACGGVIGVRLDAPDGEQIGRCRVPRTGGWPQWAEVGCPVTHVTGVRALYLVFRGAGDRFVIPKFDSDRLVDLGRYWFAAGVIGEL